MKISDPTLAPKGTRIFAAGGPRLLRLGAGLAAGSALILALLSAAGCRKAEEAKEVIRPVRAIKIGDSGGMKRRTYPGTAKAADEIDLSFRVGGNLIAFPVNVGDRVEAGQIIAKLDPRDFEVDLRNIEGQVSRGQSELEAMQKGARAEDIVKLESAVGRAQAEVENAQLEVTRYTQLVAEDVAPQIDLDRRTLHLQQRQSALTQAQKELEIGKSGARKEDLDAKKAEIASLQASADATRDQLSYTILTAPFGGTIATKYVDNFQVVQARQPVARLLDSTHIEMVIDVPESMISLVPRVKDCIVKFEALPGKEIRAKITEIGNEAKEATRTYPVTLSMEQPEGATILPGMAGVAQAGEVEEPEGAAAGATLVPSSSVFSDKSGKSFVWIVADPAMTIARREVTVGQPGPTGIQISGVSAGEWVVTAGVNYLSEGQKVSIYKNEEAPAAEPAPEAAPEAAAGEAAQ